MKKDEEIRIKVDEENEFKQIEIEYTPEEIRKIEERKKQQEQTLRANLDKYGISQEEWEAVEKLKDSTYLTLNMLLHNFDPLNLNISSHNAAAQIEPIVLSNPESLLDDYNKIYSAMCKFSLRQNKDILVYRCGHQSYLKEIEESGQTESFLSYSTDGWHEEFARGKRSDLNYECCNISQNVPCIIFSEIYGEDVENELLVPPCQDVEVINNSYDKEYGDHFSYTEMHHKYPKALTEMEQEEMAQAKQKLIALADSAMEYLTIARRKNNGAHDSSQDITQAKKDYEEWHSYLKQYISLSYRQIELEAIKEFDAINTSKLKELTEKTESKNPGILSQKLRDIGNVFERIFNRDDRESR